MSPRSAATVAIPAEGSFFQNVSGLIPFAQSTPAEPTAATTAIQKMEGTRRVFFTRGGMAIGAMLTVICVMSRSSGPHTSRRDQEGQLGWVRSAEGWRIPVHPILIASSRTGVRGETGKIGGKGV